MEKGRRKIGLFILFFLLFGVPILAVAGFLKIYDFLSVTDRVESRILVAEGWFYRSPSFRGVLTEYKRGGYDEMIIVGNRPKGTPGQGGGNSSAKLAAKRLEKLGLDAPITQVTAPYTDSERTYHLGLALREYFLLHPDKSGDLNVITRSVHARKSRLLFRTALGTKYRVGIVSAKGDCGGGKRWWLSGAGIKLVARNVAGYLYALMLAAKYKILPPPAR